eukprot:gene13045-3582_t
MAMCSRDIPSTDHSEPRELAEETFMPLCPETVLSTCQSPSKASGSAEDPFMPFCSETFRSLFRDSAEVGGSVLPTWQSMTLDFEEMDPAIFSTRHSKTCDAAETNAAILSTSHSKASNFEEMDAAILSTRHSKTCASAETNAAIRSIRHSKASSEEKSSLLASSDSKACHSSMDTLDFPNLSFALACSDSKACHSAGDKSTPFASLNDKPCHSAVDTSAPLASFNDKACQSEENKEALLSSALASSDLKPCHSADDKSAPLASFNDKACQSEENKEALLSSALASSDLKPCHSADDKSAPLASFNDKACQSEENKEALLSSALASSDLKPCHSADDKSAPLASFNDKACQSEENKEALLSSALASSDPKACESAEDKTAPLASSDPKACESAEDKTAPLASSDPKACESAEDKTAPLASSDPKACESAEDKTAPLASSDPKACESAEDKTAPLASSDPKACETAEDKTAPLASSDPKACESAEDETTPLDSFNEKACQSTENKEAFLSSAIQIASSHSKAPELAEERSGLLSSALSSSRLASSRLANSSLASFHSKTWWETCFSHVEMPAEGARGIKPEDSPYSGLLIIGNEGEHDDNDNDVNHDDGYKTSSRSNSLHLPCLQPSPPEPTIGRLILVEDYHEDDCLTPSSGSGLASLHFAHAVPPPLPPPSGSVPPFGNGSDEAQNTSNSTNHAHGFPPNDFNFSGCLSARPSVLLIHRTCPQLHGLPSLQLSFPRASSVCPSPQAAGRRLASPSRQPKTRNAKLISLGPHISELDFTPCTDFVPPYVAPKRPMVASFSTNHQSFEGPLKHSTWFPSQSGAMPVSNRAGARPIYQPQSSTRARTAGAYIDLLRGPGALMKLDETLLPGYEPRRSPTPAPRRTWYNTMLRSKTVIDPHRRSLGQWSPMLQYCAPGCESPPSSLPKPIQHTILSPDFSTLAADSTLVGELSSTPSTPGQQSQSSRRPSNLSRMSSYSGQQDLAILDELSSSPSYGQRSLPPFRPSNLSRKSSTMEQQDLAALDELSLSPSGQQSQPPRRPSNLSRKSSSMEQQDLSALDELSSSPPGQGSLPPRRPSKLGGHLFPLGEDLAILDELSSSPCEQPLLHRRFKLSPKSLSSGQDVPTFDDESSTVPRQPSMQKLAILSRKSSSLLQDFTNMTEELSPRAQVPSQQPSTLSTLGPPLPSSAQNPPSLVGSVSPSLIRHPSMRELSCLGPQALAHDGSTLAGDVSRPPSHQQASPEHSSLAQPSSLSQDLIQFGDSVFAQHTALMHEPMDEDIPDVFPSSRETSSFVGELSLLVEHPSAPACVVSFPNLTTPPLVPDSLLMHETPMMQDSVPPFESDSFLEHLASSSFVIKPSLMQDLVLDSPSRPGPKPPIRRRASCVSVVAGQASVRSRMIKKQASMIDLLMSRGGHSTPMGQSPSLSASKSSLLPDLVLDSPSRPRPKRPIRRGASCVSAIAGQASVPKPPLMRQASKKQVIGRWQASQSALKPEQMPMEGHVQGVPCSRQGSSLTRQNARQRRAAREVGPDGEPVYKEPLPKHRRSWISVYRTYMQMADERRVQKAALVTCQAVIDS